MWLINCTLLLNGNAGNKLIRPLTTSYSKLFTASCYKTAQKCMQHIC